MDDIVKGLIDKNCVINNITALPMNYKVKLFWNTVAEADSYNIYYTNDGTEPEVNNGIKLVITNTNYMIDNLINFKEYNFTVTYVK